MQIKNCEDISNGDIGYITSVTRDDTDSVLTVDFGDGRIAEYDGSDLRNAGSGLRLHPSTSPRAANISLSSSTCSAPMRSCWCVRLFIRQLHAQRSAC